MWGHCRHEHSERYDGAYETRDEAIAEGRAQHGDDAAFWILEGARPDAASFMPDADDIIERMHESASEHGEAAEEYPDVSDEAKAELDAILTAWARKHAEPRFWIGTGEPEKIEPPETT